MNETEKDKNDEYFTEEHFNQAAEKYREIREKIQQEMIELKTKLDTKNATASQTNETSTPLRPITKNTPRKKLERESEFVDLLADDNDINESEYNMPPTVAVLSYQKQELSDMFKMLRGIKPKTQGVANAQLE